MFPHKDLDVNLYHSLYCSDSKPETPQLSAGTCKDQETVACAARAGRAAPCATGEGKTAVQTAGSVRVPGYDVPIGATDRPDGVAGREMPTEGREDRQEETETHAGRGRAHTRSLGRDAASARVPTGPWAPRARRSARRFPLPRAGLRR